MLQTKATLIAWLNLQAFCHLSVPGNYKIMDQILIQFQSRAANLNDFRDLSMKWASAQISFEKHGHFQATCVFVLH